MTLSKRLAAPRPAAGLIAAVAGTGTPAGGAAETARPTSSAGGT